MSEHIPKEYGKIIIELDDKDKKKSAKEKSEEYGIEVKPWQAILIVTITILNFIIRQLLSHL